ncbi:MAG: type II toxin-antitoxin system RelE/ParE family toxin [Candidatus Gracilibacteria bacterium]|nr:type II toxin-antitoxin system RelE/ParE family toxin [Candidatus Gracilibacteria bacterium]
MYKIVILPYARQNILEVVNYIAQDNLFYANKVQEYIKKSILLLSDFPYIGKELDLIYRQIVESKYKFKIVYKLENEIIYIVAVYREQEKW